MVLEKIILVEMKNMPLNTTYEEKRIVSLGAASLISENVNQLKYKISVKNFNLYNLIFFY